MPDLRDARVLSIDVFDTLLMRAVPQPAAVFPLVADHAHAKGILRPHVSRAQFAAVREAAEANARQAARRVRGSLEVTLPEIYDALPVDWFTNATAMPAIEFDVECGVVYPNPTIVARIEEARAAGIPVVLTSDTYVTTDQLRQLLQQAGIPTSRFTHIVPSSAHGVSKHDGRLFDRVRACFPDVPSGAIHHLGDHPHADVRQAERAGLTAVPYDNGQRTLRPIVRAEAMRHGPVLPALQSLRALATTIGAPEEAEGRWWHAMGAAILGPACAAFADWVVDACARDGISTIRPLMREGALFSALIARAAATRGIDLDVAPLYASRGATWLASLSTFDETALVVLLQRSHLTIGEALATLGLSLDEVDAALAQYDWVSLADAASTPGPAGRPLDALLRDTLLSRPVRVTVDRRIADARATLASYIAQTCGNARDVAVVDLGFHGSTGRAIAAATRDGHARRFVQFLLFGADGLTRAWQRGEDIRVFGAGPGLHADLAGPIARHPAVLEALLVEGGTTVGYECVEGHVSPRLDTPQAPPAQQLAARQCRDGVLAFQSLWLRWSQARPTHADAVRHDVRGLVAPIHRLLTMPTFDEAARLGVWLHEDNDGGRAARTLTSVDAIPEGVGADAFLRAASSGTRAWGTAWAWPAGTCELRWPCHVEHAWQAAMGTGDGAPPAVQVLASRLRREGVTSCHMWGAGETGAAMLRALRQSGVDVALVIDSNPSLHGTHLDGVPVVSPDDARHHDAEVFVIASFAFADEIRSRLRDLHGETSRIVHAIEELTA